MSFGRNVYGAGLLLAAAAVGLISSGPAQAKSARGEEGLRYAKSYAEAWHEAKERGAIIFATFHKDN